MGASRVYVGAHYPHDVLVALVVGGVVSFAVTWSARRFAEPAGHAAAGRRAEAAARVRRAGRWLRPPEAACSSAAGAPVSRRPRPPRLGHVLRIVEELAGPGPAAHPRPCSRRRCGGHRTAGAADRGRARARRRNARQGRAHGMDRPGTQGGPGRRHPAGRRRGRPGGRSPRRSAVRPASTSPAAPTEGRAAACLQIGEADLPPLDGLDPLGGTHAAARPPLRGAGLGHGRRDRRGGRAPCARWRRAVAHWAEQPSKPIPADLKSTARTALDNRLDTAAVLRLLDGPGDGVRRAGGSQVRDLRPPGPRPGPRTRPRGGHGLRARARRRRVRFRPTATRQ